MGDRKKSLNGSIQFRLSLWLSCAIIVIAILAGTFSFVTALDEANELQDDILRQVAILADQQQITLTNDAGVDSHTLSDKENRVFIDQLEAGDANDGSAPQFSAQLPDGFHEVNFKNVDYRIYAKTLNSGTRIAVGQEVAVRDEIARDGALRTLLPFLILVPVLLLVARDIIRKMFLPLSRIAQELDLSRSGKMSPLPESDVPGEIRPFVLAINRLFARVAQSMSVQRRFIADAAHELRTPLTALSLQAERLMASEMSETTRQRSADLRGGIQRTRHLLDQLLTYTRLQEVRNTGEPGASVKQVFRALLEDLFPLAEAAGIDLGLDKGRELDDFPDVRVAASETELKTVLTNLVMNAINYTPGGGEVNLDAYGDGDDVCIRIADTGPGISEDEQKRVFDPFYRGLGTGQPGSGLGLSIVKTICDRLNASIRLDCKTGGQSTGLCVRICLPKSSLIPDVR